MLYGRRLDQALQHVDGSRYALVHAVAKRARQITLWLTADPAELRAEAAPPPAPGELTSRDPVALAEAEILDGEVRVRWDPEGRADEAELVEIEELETDPLLIEGLAEDDDAALDADDGDAVATPALAQALEEADAPADEAVDVEEAVHADAAVAADELAVAEAPVEEEVLAIDPDDIEEISLEDVEEPDEGDDEDEPEE
jgi:DNA-directed RNA polymerase subunit K/omega